MLYDTKHHQYDYVLALTKLNIPVHLIGATGTGKSTLVEQIADELDLPFSALPCTEATSMGSLLGFMTVTNEYATTPFREAVEHGHIFVLEELTAMNKNAILAINTLDNGWIQFPDKRVNVHPNFRLLATSNPVTAEYTGRSTLDLSTKDRYQEVQMDLDSNLEQQTISAEVLAEVSLLRDYAETNSIAAPTVRQIKRIQQITDANIHPDPIMSIYDTESKELRESITEYLVEHRAQIQANLEQQAKEAEAKRIAAIKLADLKAKPQSDMITLAELYKKLEADAS